MTLKSPISKNQSLTNGKLACNPELDQRGCVAAVRHLVSTAPVMPASYLLPFWVGLMDGDGSIQVNHWRKRSLQYRMVIKLRNHKENFEMLLQLKEHLGGSLTIQKARSKQASSSPDFVVWAENTRQKFKKLLEVFLRYPPLTSRLWCQIDFAGRCLQKNDVTWYLENRKDKYCKRAHHAELCRPLAEKVLAPNLIQDNWIQHYKRSFAPYGSAWLSGFIEAEGSFYVREMRQKNDLCAPSKNGRIILGHIDDLYLLQCVLSFLGSSIRVTRRKKSERCSPSVAPMVGPFYVIQTGHKAAFHRLEKHFQTAPLLGFKRVQYERFLKILAQSEKKVV